MLFPTLVLQCYWKIGKLQKDTFLREKTKENQTNVTIIVSVDGEGKVFPLKLKEKGTWLSIKKYIFKKYLVDLIDINHQINMASDHYF